MQRIFYRFYSFVFSTTLMGVAGGCSDGREHMQFVDKLGASAGSIGRTNVRDLTERTFGQIHLDRIAASDIAEVYSVRGQDDAIIIREGGGLYLIEDPSIRVSHITQFRVCNQGVYWTQKDEDVKVEFYFQLKNRDFVYIRHTLEGD